MARRSRARKKLSVKSVILSIIFLLVVLAGYYVYTKFFKKEEPFIEAKGAISFHFMMLGNEYTGDCIYIKAGDNDILIDGGSKTNSSSAIDNYIKNYGGEDKTIEYVIVTHGDQDHIAAFAGDGSNASLFSLYDCKTIIDFPKTNKVGDKETNVIKRYYQMRDLEVDGGAKHYSALECYNEQNGAKKVYNLTEDGNVKMEILYNYYYENSSSDENNYSVCVMFYHGSRKFLFTGDLEKEGEEELAKKYDFSQVELFKAGHHGSYTSSNETLLSEIMPKMSVVCCCAGSIERTTRPERLFPSQEFINRMCKHTSNIYVSTAMDYVVPDGETTVGTSDNVGDIIILNGNIVVISDAEDGVYVECSNNNTKLKDTDWFKKYRTWPSYGKA